MIEKRLFTDHKKIQKLFLQKLMDLSHCNGSGIDITYLMNKLKDNNIID